MKEHGLAILAQENGLLALHHVLFSTPTHPERIRVRLYIHRRPNERSWPGDDKF